RKALFQPGARRRFCRAIPDRDRAPIRLGLDGDLRGEVAERDTTAQLRQLRRRLEVLGHATLRTGSCDWTIALLSTATVVRPSWRIPATSAASARPASRTSTTCAALPAPPEATTGMVTDSTTFRVSATS